MANQPEVGTYDAGVYQLATTDPVTGGLGGIANAPLLNLANRTGWLKAQITTLQGQAAAAAPLNSPAFTGTPTAPTPPAGDDSNAIADTAWVDNARYGIATVNVAGGANVTLSAAQYGAGIIVLTGAITAAIAAILPANGKWLILNQTTGAFSVTAKTAAGVGVVLPSGVWVPILGDGTNITTISPVEVSPGAVGSTPPAGDASTKLATTAFVKRAGWQLAGQIVITASTSLTASQAGNCIQVANTTGPITVTLPASNSAATGDLVCLIWNDSRYTATVAVPSGDYINIANTVLQPGQSMAAYNDGGAVWDKIFNEADTYQAVAPVYADVVGVSPWNPYTVTATITAPKAGWVLAAAKWIGTGGSTSPQAGLYFNGTQFSRDQANPYEQVEYGFVQASAGEVITIQFEIGTQGAANNAALMAWFVPQAN